MSVFFIRASILALYISIFQIPTFRMAGYVIHGINAAFFVSTVLAVCLICRPLAFSWNQQIPGGTCGDQKSLDVYIGVFNLLLDVTVVLLPMPVLWGLQMASSKKVILSGMFGLGVMCGRSFLLYKAKNAVLICWVRICVLTLIRARISAENHGSNAQKIYGIIALFTDLEALIGVINACLPVMKPIFVKLHSSKASSWFNSVMSGSILIFVRPSQLGSAWKSRPTTKRHSTHKHPTPKEMAPWPLDDKDYDAQIEVQESPPPRYADKRPTKMMSAYSPIKSPPVKSPTPPVPPKGRSYSPAKRLAPAEEQDRGGALGIYVERSWDVERGERGESAHSDREELVQYPQRLW